MSHELGSVKNLRINPTDYATEYFGEQETAILLKVESENFFSFKKNDIWKLAFLPTAYVVPREGNVFTRVCPSIHPSICLSTSGGVPRPGPGGGVPQPGPAGGYPCGGTPPQVPPVRPGRVELP